MKPLYETAPWGELLRAAQDEREIVTVVRQLLYSVDPGDLKRLPAECRDVSVTNVETLGAWTTTLNHVELVAIPKPQQELLRVIAEVLTCAQAQLASIRVRGAPARNH